MWYSHVISLVLNAATAVLIWQLVSLTDALLSMLYSTITAELMIFTQPVKSIRDYEVYRRSYGKAPVQSGNMPLHNWFITLSGSGIAVGVRF